MECDHKMKRSYTDNKLAPPIACNAMELVDQETKAVMPLSVPSMAAAASATNQMSAVTAAYATNQMPAVTGGMPNSASDWMKSVTCYKCGGMGHIARLCPSLDTVPALPTPQQSSVPRGRGRGSGGGRGNSYWRGGQNNRGQGRGGGDGSFKNNLPPDDYKLEVDKPPPKETPPVTSTQTELGTLNRAVKMRRRRSKRLPVAT